MISLEPAQYEHLLEHARGFVGRSMPYSFSKDEQAALRLFFTNLDRSVFFIINLPANVQATLAAMFSRLKNPRGIRGLFVDSFLPALLASSLDEVTTEFDDKADRFLKARGITSLEKFLEHSPICEMLLGQFLEKMSIDPNYLAKIADSEKIRRFFETWLDKFGHTSITRMGSVCICFEGISLLAAKSLEWNRPASGFIELSTRFVNLRGADVYPVGKELSQLCTDWPLIAVHLEFLFEMYRMLQEESMDGPFPGFLRSRYSEAVEESGGNLEMGIMGETCDVLGNLLPAATLTSVCGCQWRESSDDAQTLTPR